ncbi:MAG: hypothetical protein IKQ92_09580 [Clostridia bacterium]|nr:hypothetical protein [Clostridia bacterium]
MKRTYSLPAALLAALLCLSSCSPKQTADRIENEMTDRENGTANDASHAPDGMQNDEVTNGSTLGDLDGDGVVGHEDSMANTEAANAVKHVKSADDAVNFISANVYSLCRDSLPLLTETRALRDDEIKSLPLGVEADDMDTVNDVIISESAAGAAPFSLMLLRTDGTKTETLRAALRDLVDPELIDGTDDGKKAVSVTLDDDIVLVMGNGEQVDSVVSALKTAARDVYGEIGESRTVLG